VLESALVNFEKIGLLQGVIHMILEFSPLNFQVFIVNTTDLTFILSPNFHNSFIWLNVDIPLITKYSPNTCSSMTLTLKVYLLQFLQLLQLTLTYCGGCRHVFLLLYNVHSYSFV